MMVVRGKAQGHIRKRKAKDGSPRYQGIFERKFNGKIYYRGCTFTDVHGAQEWLRLQNLMFEDQVRRERTKEDLARIQSVRWDALK